LNGIEIEYTFIKKGEIMNCLKKTIYTTIMFFAIIIQGNAINNVDLYGNVTVGTWWSNEYNFNNDTLRIITNKKSLDTTKIDTTSIIRGKDPEPINKLGISPYGLIGIKFKTEKFNVCFEFEATKDVNDLAYFNHITFGKNLFSRTSLFARINKGYAEWNINNIFSILIGKTDVPTNLSMYNRALYGGNGLGNSGILKTFSKPVIQLTAKTSNSSWFTFSGKIAASMVDTMYLNLAKLTWKDTIIVDDSGKSFLRQVVTNAGWIDTMNVRSELFPNIPSTFKIKNSIPKLEGKFDVNLEKNNIGLNVSVTGGYQEYTLLFKPDNEYYYDTAKSVSKRIQAYVAGVATGIKIGPILISGSCSGGMNFGIYGVDIINPLKWQDDTANSRTIDVYYPKSKLPGNEKKKIVKESIINIDTVTPSDLETFLNSHTLQTAFSLKVKPVSFLSAEGGFSLIMAKHGENEKEIRYDNTYTWYGQMNITILNYMILTPEIGCYNYGPHYKQGKFFYWGFNTTFNF